jgi:hypothetical protein
VCAFITHERYFREGPKAREEGRRGARGARTRGRGMSPVQQQWRKEMGGQLPEDSYRKSPKKPLRPLRLHSSCERSERVEHRLAALRGIRASARRAHIRDLSSGY